MNDKVSLTVAKINRGTNSDKNFVLIIYNEETKESIVKFFEDNEEAKEEYYFAENILRLSNETFF